MCLKAEKNMNTFLFMDEIRKNKKGNEKGLAYIKLVHTNLSDGVKKDVK